MKASVKKNRQNKSNYARQKQRDKELWTMKVIAYIQQETLDAVALTLKDEFGFGEVRQKQFHDAFESKYAEIRELEKNDTSDNEYAIAKIEQALQAAYGRYYQPRETRYDVHVILPDGSRCKL